MTDLGLGLYAAHSLISGAAEDENSGGTNWPEVVKRYEASRVGKGQGKAATYDRGERRRIERTIELINAKGRGAANDGLGVILNYASEHLQTSSWAASDVNARFLMSHAFCASR